MKPTILDYHQPKTKKMINQQYQKSLSFKRFTHGDSYTPPYPSSPTPLPHYHSANSFPSSAPLSSTAFQPATSSSPWFLSNFIPIPFIFWYFSFSFLLSTSFFYSVHPTSIRPALTTTAMAKTNHHNITHTS